MTSTRAGRGVESSLEHLIEEVKKAKAKAEADAEAAAAAAAVAPEADKSAGEKKGRRRRNRRKKQEEKQDDISDSNTVGSRKSSKVDFGLLISISFTSITYYKINTVLKSNFDNQLMQLLEIEHSYN